MLRANIEAQIEVKQKEMEVAEHEILRLSNMIANLKDMMNRQLEIRGLAAYDLMELREQLEEDK